MTDKSLGEWKTKQNCAYHTLNVQSNSIPHTKIAKETYSDHFDGPNTHATRASKRRCRSNDDPALEEELAYEISHTSDANRAEPEDMNRPRGLRNSCTVKHQNRQQSDEHKLALGCIRHESDDVLDLWYEDPYERNKPDMPAYDEWRRRVIFHGLRDRGYHSNTSSYLTAWFMRCNGIFSQLQDQKKRLPRERGLETKETQISSVESSKEIHGQKQVTQSAHDSEEDEDEDEDDEKGEDKKEVSILLTGLREYSSADSDLETATPSLVTEGECSQTSCEEKRMARSRLQNSRRKQTSETRPTKQNWNDLSTDEKIKSLKLRLKLYNMIYGETGLNGKSPSRFKYLSSSTDLPRSIPLQGFMTQGHYTLKPVSLEPHSIALSNHVIELAAYQKLPPKAKHHGLEFNQTKPHPVEVATEDPTFGITRFSSKDTATVEDLELRYNHTNLPKKGARSPKWERSGIEHQMELEATKTEQKREDVLQQLEKRCWDWETPEVMQALPGMWIQNGNDTKENFSANKFSLSQDEVWIRAQQRLDILAQGGEAAEEILRMEAEEAKLGEKRMKQREEAARANMRKRAEDMGTEYMDVSEGGGFGSWSSIN